MARKKTKPVAESYEVQQRRKRALELRLAGYNQTQIAEQMDLHKSTISAYIQTALRDIPRERAEEYRELELSRLDAMWAAIWPRIIEPKTATDRKAQPWLMDRAFEIVEKRARLTGAYKAAELQAIADAKGNNNSEAASMIVDLFGALKGAFAEEEAAQADDPGDAQPAEDDDDAEGVGGAQ